MAVRFREVAARFSPLFREIAGRFDQTQPIAAPVLLLKAPVLLLKVTDNLEGQLGTLRRKAKNTARVLGKSAVATAVSLTSLLGLAGTTKAADRNIYPDNHATTPWTFQDIQDYLDPTACASNGGGPYGQPCPTAGDNIIFNGHADGTTGVYTPLAGPPTQNFKLRTDNVNLLANNAMFQGNPADIAQGMLVTYSGGNTISGFTFQATAGSQIGIVGNSGFTPENPVTVTGNNFYDFVKGASWVNTSTAGANLSSGFNFVSNYVKDNFSGLIFSEAGQGADSTTIRAKFANNTVEGLNALGYQPMIIFVPSGADGAVSRGGIMVPGLDEFVGNIFINSNGVPLPPDVLEALPSSRLTTAGVPSRNGEFQVGQNPAPGIPYVGPLEVIYPTGDNFNEPMYFNAHKKPIIGISDNVVSRKAGAFKPAGDAVGEILAPGYETGDWQITSADMRHFAQTLFNPPAIIPGSLVPNSILTHDADGDMDVDMIDYDIIVSAITGPQQDCNGNGIGDWTEVQTEQDLSDLIAREPNAPSSPLENQVAVPLSNRFLMVNPNNNGMETSILVTPTSMPQGYENLLGHSWYVGPVTEIGELGSSTEVTADSGSFFASRLQCEPYSAVWTNSKIAVTGDIVFAGGSYDVQNLNASCVPLAENLSVPYATQTVATRGDVSGPSGFPGDGTNIDDALKILAGFSSASGRLSKTRTDMEPAVIDFKINISDVLDGLAGFVGVAYDKPAGLCPGNQLARGAGKYIDARIPKTLGR